MGICNYPYSIPFQLRRGIRKKKKKYLVVLTLQKVRLALVLVVWEHPNLLILDEISTHLDFDTVSALELALNAFNGAILLVTHDRSMMKAVVEGQRPYDH
jgi:ABC-type Mn2+/Zn2+ transport system ATPase subunit